MSGLAANRSKKSQLREQQSPSETSLTKEEQQIAKFLRLKCAVKQGNLAGMKVDFFIANKLVDHLMESKWGPGKTDASKSARSAANQKNAPLLANRAACVTLMQRFLNSQLFYRAIKIYKEELETTSGSKTETNESSSEKTPNLRKRKKDSAQSSEQASATHGTDSTNKKEQKRKFKLELHNEQKFVDSNEPYVWIYDPVSPKTYIIGSLLILGAIGICLFPLWPSQVREGVYYVSLAGASFLGAILSLAVIKYILFALVWLCTMGGVHFWLFPNLTEDVGFVESFIPVYKCIYTNAQQKNKCEKIVSGESAPASNESEIVSQEIVRQEETITTTKMTSSMTASMIKKNDNNNTIITELSKSTVEISTSQESPSLLNKNRKQSIKIDEEEFELVDNEDNE